MSQTPLPPEAPTLNYAADTGGRPGAMTAIGILSICLGALGALINLGETAALIIVSVSMSRPINSLMDLFLADTTANAAVSIFLLVIGFQTLRNSPRSAIRHRLYACIKILLALALTLLSANRYSMETLSSTRHARSGLVVGVRLCATFLFTIAYPVILLIVLRSSRIRAYYEQLNSQ